MDQTRSLFCLGTMTNIVQNLNIKVQMVFLGFELGNARLKAQTDPTSLKVNLSPTKYFYARSVVIKASVVGRLVAAPIRTLVRSVVE